MILGDFTNSFQLILVSSTTLRSSVVKLLTIVSKTTNSAGVSIVSCSPSLLSRKFKNNCFKTAGLFTFNANNSDRHKLSIIRNEKNKKNQTVALAILNISLFNNLIATP